MYFPFRHDVNAKESMLNSSASMVLDSGSSVRPFASSSFSAQSGTQPFVHHGGNLQGLHNIQGNYSMQSVQNALPSRNQGMAGGLSTGTHQPTGGRFSSNNLPVGLPQQLSHVGLHGHTPMTSRSGISVVGNHAFSSSSNGGGGSGPGGSLGAATVGNRGSFSALGASGPRIGSSGGSIGGGGGGLVGGGGLTRALNAGVGLDVQNLNGSRVNIGPLTGDSGIGGQGPGRSGTSMLQQGVNMSSSTYNPSSDLLAMISRGSPKGISLLGNNFSTAPGSGVQGQVLSGNGQLGSLGLTNDGGANDGLAFDISEFPQLGARQSSSGGLQGPLASLRKQGVSVNAIVQQNQEFTIQNEDFPALPGFRGGSSELTSESEHHKDQQHENALAANMPQHFMMGRSAGMLPGGSYVPHRQLQQQLAGTVSGSMASMNASDLQHLHANIADSFPSSHGLSASYHSQAVGPPGAGGAQVHRSGTGSPGLGSYDQLVHHYHQSQVRQGGASHQQQQLAQQQMVRDLVKVQQRQVAPEQFGLLGLLSVIRMSDPDLTTLALGTDLTTLGLNLNSRENLYKTFASPWAEAPTRGEPEFTLPQCYVHEAPRLQPGYFSKFQQDTLFYIFYSMPNDEAQLYAADELCKRGWFFHREHKLWLIHDPNMEPFVKADAFERGSYYFFDHNIWETGRKENFVLQYDMIEKRPQLPSQH